MSFTNENEPKQEAKQEPVAWHFEFNNGSCTTTFYAEKAEEIRRYMEPDEKETVLYAAPAHCANAEPCSKCAELEAGIELAHKLRWKAERVSQELAKKLDRDNHKKRIAELAAAKYSAETTAHYLHERFYPEDTEWQALDDLAGLQSQISNMVCGIGEKFSAALAACDVKQASATQPAQEAKQEPRKFQCFSTNDGDSWYEHPADAQLLEDVGAEKVGDEFEVMAGWRCVTARYRIVKAADETSDDAEVECISHPHENAAPAHCANAEPVAWREWDHHGRWWIYYEAERPGSLPLYDHARPCSKCAELEQWKCNSRENKLIAEQMVEAHKRELAEAERQRDELLEALIVLHERHQIDDPHHADLCEFCKQADATLAAKKGEV